VAPPLRRQSSTAALVENPATCSVHPPTYRIAVATSSIAVAALRSRPIAWPQISAAGATFTSERLESNRIPAQCQPAWRSFRRLVTIGQPKTRNLKIATIHSRLQTYSQTAPNSRSLLSNPNQTAQKSLVPCKLLTMITNMGINRPPIGATPPCHPLTTNRRRQPQRVATNRPTCCPLSICSQRVTR
jgi:hypothetical protein